MARRSSFDVAFVDVNQETIDNFQFFENVENWPHNDLVSYINYRYDSLGYGKSYFMSSASIVEPNCKPIGYYANDNQQYLSVNSSDGSGNFYLKPNGGFLITNDDIVVCESSENLCKPLRGLGYLKIRGTCDYCNNAQIGIVYSPAVLD